MRAIIVGAGLAGLTAGVLLKRAGYSVLVFDTRYEIGGNCAETVHSGISVHKYGPHIFHTSSEEAYKFISQFTKLNKYVHRVLARTFKSLELLPIPYCLKTELAVGKKLSDKEIKELFFTEYSAKMWGMSFDKLPEHIKNRVPQRRTDNDDRYFTDTYQGIPDRGYNLLFTKMVDYIGFDNVHLGVKPDTYKRFLNGYDLLVYTGCIDSFYDYQFGALPYRTLKFEFWKEDFQQVAPVINECNSIKHYTRTADYSIVTWEPNKKIYVRGIEIPSDYNHKEKDSIPIYPMNWGDNLELYKKYAALEPSTKTVFCGRLATYQYLDMDKVVLDTTQRINTVLGKK